MSNIATAREGQPSAFLHALAMVGTGATVRAGSRIVVAACSFLTTALVVRMLGVPVFGALAFGVSMVGLVTGLFAGFGIAATRTLAAKLASGRRVEAEAVTQGLVTAVIAVWIIGTMVVVAAVVLTQRQLGTVEAVVVTVSLGALLAGRIGVIAGSAVARGFGHVLMMEAPGLAEVISKLLLVVSLFALSVTRIGPVATAYGVAGLAALATSISIIRSAHGLTSVLTPVRAAGYELLRVTGPYAVAAVAYRLIHGFDVAVLGAVHPGATVGAYAPALTLVESLVMLVPVLLSAIFVTAATGLYESGDRSSYADLYVTVGKFSLTLAMPAFVLLAIAPGDSLRFVYGGAFPVSDAVVRILLAGFFVTVVLGFNGQSLIASGARKTLWRAFLWPAITMAASAVLLVPPFAAVGAAAATAISFVVLNLSLSTALFRRTGVHPVRRDFILLVATSPLAAGLAATVFGAIGPGFWVAVGSTLVGWVAWIALAGSLGAIRVAELRGIRPRALSPRESGAGR
jgi:O-antigen/teichoic acid export membrane protein